MTVISLRSPAKLNLYLRVIRKWDDGFHEIHTIFERIDLADSIRFETVSKPGIQILCDHPGVPCGSKNLIYRAAELLARNHHVTPSIRITLKKNIPVAAGLGGGSSNAAATLRGLNQLWQLQLPFEALLGYGQRIGSDVPFFLWDTPWGEGVRRGDHITPLAIDTCLWHVLVVPKRPVYTWKVYGELNLALTKKTDNASILIRHLREKRLSEVVRYMSNDLQSVVFDMVPPLQKTASRMKSLGAAGVMVSGSGPSIYAIVTSKHEADAMASELKKRYSQVFVVKTL